MKKLFLLAWPIALAAVSCSNEEVVSVNNDANEIKFAVVAENGTRAQNLFCNVNKPTNFHVWAAVNGAQYFANASYTDNGGTFYIDGGSTRYWPDASKTVDFYAVTEETAVAVADPATAAVYNDWSTGFGWNSIKQGATEAAASTITWTTRSLKAPEQTDLLYAYTRASRPAYGVATPINFRHALSQIVFKAVNTNKTIDVEINQVEVVNIAESGVFTMPFGNLGTEEAPNWNVTDANVKDHTTGGAYPAKGVGKWDIQTTNATPNKTYTTTQFTKVQVLNTVTNLTDEVGTNSPEAHPMVKQSLLLIPQTTTAWDKASAPGATGSYFKVYCHIRNIAGSAVTDSDIDLWGTKDDFKAVYIPVAAAWEPGKKYIYTFNFGGDTTGGYDEEGKPVLFPISFTITVDDFVKVTPDPVVPMK